MWTDKGVFVTMLVTSVLGSI